MAWLLSWCRVGMYFNVSARTKRDSKERSTFWVLISTQSCVKFRLRPEDVVGCLSTAVNRIEHVDGCQTDLLGNRCSPTQINGLKTPICPMHSFFFFLKWLRKNNWDRYAYTNTLYQFKLWQPPFTVVKNQFIAGAHTARVILWVGLEVTV